MDIELKGVHILLLPLVVLAGPILAGLVRRGRSGPLLLAPLIPAASLVFGGNKADNLALTAAFVGWLGIWLAVAYLAASPPTGQRLDVLKASVVAFVFANLAVALVWAHEDQTWLLLLPVPVVSGLLALRVPTRGTASAKAAATALGACAVQVALFSMHARSHELVTFGVGEVSVALAAWAVFWDAEGSRGSVGARALGVLIVSTGFAVALGPVAYALVASSGPPRQDLALECPPTIFRDGEFETEPASASCNEVAKKRRIVGGPLQAPARTLFTQPWFEDEGELAVAERSDQWSMKLYRYKFIWRRQPTASPVSRIAVVGTQYVDWLIVGESFAPITHHKRVNELFATFDHDDFKPALDEVGPIIIEIVPSDRWLLDDLIQLHKPLNDLGPLGNRDVKFAISPETSQQWFARHGLSPPRLLGDSGAEPVPN